MHQIVSKSLRTRINTLYPQIVEDTESVVNYALAATACSTCCSSSKMFHNSPGLFAFQRNITFDAQVTVELQSDANEKTAADWQQLA